MKYLCWWWWHWNILCGAKFWTAFPYICYRRSALIFEIFRKILYLYSKLHVHHIFNVWNICINLCQLWVTYTAIGISYEIKLDLSYRRNFTYQLSLNPKNELLHWEMRVFKYNIIGFKGVQNMLIGASWQMDTWKRHEDHFCFFLMESCVL